MLLPLSSSDPIGSIPKTKTALIVDDVPSVRRYHETVLQAAGFTCLAAQNGLEAVAILKTSSVDFVMVDLVMPKMGGAEFIQRLREDPVSAHVPVLVVTAETKSDGIRKERTEATGPVGYVRKPVMPKALRDEVTRLLL
ncbi:MAG: response regulator [Opitutaceae bacterium]|nr:response regulator [Opitutaceae bacterium]